MGLGAGSAARFAGAGALVLFLSWQHVQATRFGYRVESTRREAAQRRGRVAALRIQIDQRFSPEQVATRAEKMGLVPAAPEALRRLSERAGPADDRSLSRLFSRRLAPLVAATRS